MWSRAGAGPPVLRTVAVLALAAGAALPASFVAPARATGNPAPALYGWGANTQSQLAVAGDPVKRPTLVPFTPACPPTAPPQCVPIAGGYDFTLAVEADGSVWGWGDNASGQLGDPGQLGTSVTSPTRVPGLPSPAAKQAVGIAAGRYHSVALLRDTHTGATEVWTWGTDPSGVGLLGQGSVQAGGVSSGPVQVVGPGGTGKLSAIVAVAAGELHSAALHSPDGSVWSWGEDSYGELGQGLDPAGHAVPPTGSPVPARLLVGTVRLGLLDRVTQLAADGLRTVALRDGGSVWSWGEGYEGEIGDGQPSHFYSAWSPSQMVGVADGVAVAAGYHHTLVLERSGLVVGAGSDDSGQLGVPCPPAAQSTGQEPCTTNVAIQVPGIVNASRIGAGGGFSMAGIGDTVATWGADDRGQRGDGGQSTSAPTVAPNIMRLGTAYYLAGGDSHALALTNTGGQPIPSASLAPSSLQFSPQRVGTPSKAQQLILANTGTVPLGVSGISAPKEFAAAYSGCTGAPLPPNGSCAIAVTFDPTQSGPAGGTLTVTDDAGTQSASLSGMGTGASPPSPPTVTGIQPSSGPTAGGTAVHLSGTGLKNATVVAFGGTVATAAIVPDAVPDLGLTVVSPPHPVGAVDVTVTTPVATSLATRPADVFTYTDAVPGQLVPASKGAHPPTVLASSHGLGGGPLTPALPGGTPGQAPVPVQAPAPMQAPGPASGAAVTSALMGNPAPSGQIAMAGMPKPAEREAPEVSHMVAAETAAPLGLGGAVLCAGVAWRGRRLLRPRCAPGVRIAC